jgi:phosphatidylinositol glycan class W
MDLGAGSFAFGGGGVAAPPILKERATGKATPLHQRLLYSMRQSLPPLPLLILGVIQTLSVKGLDYAEHVTEYGMHWNFFFTLGLLPPFVAIFQSVSKIVLSYAALLCFWEFFTKLFSRLPALKFTSFLHHEPTLS